MTVSYSKLDLFKKCPFRYKKRYVERNYSNADSLATEFGSLLHKALELKGQDLMDNRAIDYDEIHNVLLAGYDEKTEKGQETILGAGDLRVKYCEEWFAADEKTNQSTEDRFNIFVEKVLPSRMENMTQKIVGTEIPFEFVYDERCIFHGFIDRVDGTYEDNELRALTVTDYKSSKKIFPVEDIRTPLQMVTYDLACLFLYGVLPDNHVYDFIGINQKQGKLQGVCTKGYLKRGIKKIDSLLDQIGSMEESNEYPPKPSPLCHWCDFCETNPRAEDKCKFLCPYFSLWTPENKTFQTNEKYEPGKQPEEKKRREFIF